MLFKGKNTQWNAHSSQAFECLNNFAMIVVIGIAHDSIYEKMILIKLEIWFSTITHVKLDLMQWDFVTQMSSQKRIFWVTACRKMLD